MTLAVAAAVAQGRATLAGAGVGLPELEAQLLLAHASGLGRAQLFARSGEPLAGAALRRYEELLGARARRVPFAYLTGAREFWSLDLAVTPAVLIPRPETETLVEAALARVGSGVKLLDVGTGSGAVVIALAREVGAGSWWATDCSAAALRVARANAEAHGCAGRVSFACGDLFAPLAGHEGSFDCVVSNPPYIPTGDLAGLQPEVREHEPRLALDGGPDGLGVISRLLEEAPRFLRPGGWLLLEVGAGQAGAVRGRALAGGAYDAAAVHRDLAGIERVVALQRSAAWKA